MCLKHQRRYRLHRILQGVGWPFYYLHFASGVQKRPWVECLYNNTLLLVADGVLKIQIGSCKRPEFSPQPFLFIQRALQSESAFIQSHSCQYSPAHYLIDCQLVVRRDNQSLTYIQRNWSFKSNLGFGVFQKDTQSWRRVGPCNRNNVSLPWPLQHLRHGSRLPGLADFSAREMAASECPRSVPSG